MKACRARWLATALSGALVAACGHVPVTSMYALRNFDPATTDLARFRTAVSLPAALLPSPDGVRLVVTVERAAGAPPAREELLLEASLDPRETAELARQVAPGSKAHVFRLAAKDVERFARLREEIKRARESGTGRGSLSVSAAACRLTAQMPASVPVTTYIKSAETEGFVPLVVGYDILAEAATRQAAVLPVCPNGAPGGARSAP